MSRTTITFGYIDEFPVVFSSLEAWTCINGKWEAFHPADAFHDAKIITEHEFELAFPNLPALPEVAFAAT